MHCGELERLLGNPRETLAGPAGEFRLAMNLKEEVYELIARLNKSGPPGQD
jgi:hypothetical protein